MANIKRWQQKEDKGAYASSIFNKTRVRLFTAAKGKARFERAGVV